MDVLAVDCLFLDHWLDDMVDVVVNMLRDFGSFVDDGTLLGTMFQSIMMLPHLPVKERRIFRFVGVLLFDASDRVDEVLMTFRQILTGNNRLGVVLDVVNMSFEILDALHFLSFEVTYIFVSDGVELTSVLLRVASWHDVSFSVTSYMAVVEDFAMFTATKLASDRNEFTGT
ncbi:hypothetical protein EXT69_22535 [Pantoea agglomerans]|nr:hypothetical protein [Pantoea agglomerans]